MTTIRRIGILRTQTLVGCIFIDHRVHTTWGNTEEKSWSSEFLKVTEIPVPVRLWHDSHAITSSLKGTTYHGSTK